MDGVVDAWRHMVEVHGWMEAHGGWMEAHGRGAWVDGWRHWLTKYTNKENTFHNIATFHTTIPT